MGKAAGFGDFRRSEDGSIAPLQHQHFLREPLLRLYIRDSADAVLQGAMRMRLMSLLYPFAAMMDITASTLRGMGKSLFPTIVSVVCICGVRLLWVFTVFQQPAFHSLVGLCCFPLSWILAFLVHF